MRYYAVRALVLRRHNLGEADRIITLLSRENGKLRAVARAVRKTTSRLSGNLEPFADIDVRLVRGKNLDTIIGAKARRVYRLDQGDITRLGSGLLLLEMADRLLPELQPQVEVYDLLLSCFAELAGDVAPVVIQNYFSYKLLELLGYLPELPQQKSESCYLDLEHGRFSARRSGPHAIAIDSATLKLWRLIQSVPLSDIKRVVHLEELSRDSLAILQSFYRYRFELEFKSFSLL